ncbi:MAG: M3 family oligoendopeptidase [Candidatus Hodarchaeales archaeon]
MTTNWDLSFMYKGYDDPQIDADLETAEKLADEIAVYRGKISSGELSSQELLTLLQKIEQISDLTSKAGGYGFLLFAQETTNDNYKMLYGKMQQRATDISNKLIWARLEISKLDDNVAKKYLSDPILSNYHHFIEVNRLNKPYLLSEPEEKILNMKSLVGVNAWNNFYDEYTAAFQFEVEIEGEKKVLSSGEMRPLFRDPRPEVRKEVFKKYYQKYAENSIAISHCFNNVWKDHGQNVELRKYPDTMTIAHIRNQTDEEIVKTMMDVVRKNYDLVQEYYKTKAKLLYNKDKIIGSDLYAPLGRDIKYTWEEAQKLVIEAYSEFDEEIGSMAIEFFEHHLIDSEVRKNKMTGAFCAAVSPKLEPVIHMSFDGTPDGVSTLAHEMGHGLHDKFASRKQTLFNFHPPLVVAETASVFGEQILIGKLINGMKDEEAKLKLIASQIEDAIATISRQTMYVFFEKECHEKGARQTLSAEEMGKIWDKYVREVYGDSVDFLPEQTWNWASIPHFIMTRFYCYAYSFGMLFVLGLYQKYLEEGKSFIPKYKSILEAGGSQFPVDLAASVGLDITKPEFWQAGFDYLKSLLKEFKTLVDKRS